VNVDLVLLGLVLFFAIWGAFAGVARQIAQIIGAVGAWLLARPCGDILGPTVGKDLGLPLLAGTVMATFICFLILFLVLRGVATMLIQRFLSGKEPGNRGLDRGLGFLFGGAKVGAVAWVTICALSFVEDNVSVMGKKLGLSPKDSQAFALARTYNLFEMTSFGDAQTLKAVLKGVNNPKALERLKDNADYQALKKDPRFAKAQGSDEVRKALETGDVRALLKSADLIKLLQDPQALRRLERLSTILGASSP
jgi:membrane protein required for colicin V production